MKRLVIYFLMLSSLLSCNVSDDDAIRIQYEILPVESYILPDEFELGEVYEIMLSYVRPTTCHAYHDIYYVSESNERTIAIVNKVFVDNNNCEDITSELETSFSFQALNTGSYIFKFWQGTDANGNDEYITVEVPVID